MEKFNVKYSDMTEDILEEYFDMYDKKTRFHENQLKCQKLCASIFQLITQICNAVLIFVITLICIKAWCKHLQPAWRNRGLASIPQTLIGIFIIYILVCTFYELLKLVSAKVSERLFSLYHLQKKQIKKRREIQERYHTIFQFQERLRNSEVYEITDEYPYLVVTYRNKNGISGTDKFNIRGHKADIIKEDVLDFTWLDHAIRNELTVDGFGEFSEGVFIPNHAEDKHIITNKKQYNE